MALAMIMILALMVYSLGQRQLRRALELRFFGLSYAMDGVIRNETLIETDITAIFVNCWRSGAN
jgi:hypothetical protein